MQYKGTIITDKMFVKSFYRFWGKSSGYKVVHKVKGAVILVVPQKLSGSIHLRVGGQSGADDSDPAQARGAAEPRTRTGERHAIRG